LFGRGRDGPQLMRKSFGELAIEFQEDQRD
jgi:hypothetical protein